MLAIAFGAGSLLWIGAAAAAPVVIHLIMRTKPRRTVFPALRFVRKTHKANLSKLRLKHLLLLLMRMLAIGLIGFLLAQPFLEDIQAEATRAPTAAVIIVDDSASMGYEFKGKSLLLSSRDQIEELINDLPPGSRFAVLASSDPARSGGLTGDRQYALRRLGEIQPGQGHQSLSGALAEGVALLGGSKLPRKELYVVSDMTRWSWREVNLSTAPETIRSIVLNARRGQATNISLSNLRLSASRVPLGQSVVLDAVVRCGPGGGQVRLRAQAGDRLLGDATMDFQANEVKTFQVSDTPDAPGPSQGTVRLTPDDALAFDNIRYFTVEVMPRPKLLLVRDAATIGRVDPTTQAMIKAVAATGSVEYSVTTTDPRRLDREAIEQARFVLLSGVSALTLSQWQALEEHVEEGGILWVVAGPLVSAAGYDMPEPRGLLPAPIEGLESLEKPQSWKDVKTDHPLLSPFGPDGDAWFDPIEFLRRLKLGPVAPQTQVLARYQDDTPGLLLRTVGKGSVLLWNFSPARSFSNLHADPTLPVLVSRALTVLPGRGERRTLFTLGQKVTLVVPEDLGGVTVRARGPEGAGEQSLPVDIRTGSVGFRPAQVGNWQVEFVGSQATIIRGLSVNTHPSESDLEPIEPEQLALRMPGGNVRIVTELDQLRRDSQAYSALDLAPLALAVLLALMIGESFFANRFYRQVSTPESPDTVSR